MEKIDIFSIAGTQRRIKIISPTGSVEYSEWFLFNEMYMLNWKRALENGANDPYDKRHGCQYEIEKRELVGGPGKEEGASNGKQR